MKAGKEDTRDEMKDLREKAPRIDQLKLLKGASARGITKFVNDAARETRRLTTT